MAVNLRKIVLAPKTGISFGAWHNGKVPKTDFPIAKGAYNIGNSFEWCVIKFVAEIGPEKTPVECRVLVVLHIAKQKFAAILGIMDGAMVRVLCSYEYHATEPGWHCHAACDDIGSVPAGFMRGPWVRRIPHPHRTHRSLDLNVFDRDSAKRKAQECYRIEVKGSLI